MKLKKRQVVRKTIIFISFLTFPVVMFYFSPVVIIRGAYKGIVVGSFITFVSMFLASLFVGRAICGWYCPAAGLQECAQYAKNKPARNGKVNLIKFFIWVPWPLHFLHGWEITLPAPLQAGQVVAILKSPPIPC